MNEVQLEKIKEYATKLGSSIEHCDVEHDDWAHCSSSITVTVHRQGTPPHGLDPIGTVRINTNGDFIGVCKEVSDE